MAVVLCSLEFDPPEMSEMDDAVPAATANDTLVTLLATIGESLGLGNRLVTTWNEPETPARRELSPGANCSLGANTSRSATHRGAGGQRKPSSSRHHKCGARRRSSSAAAVARCRSTARDAEQVGDEGEAGATEAC